ncbi:unnamed protein product [Ectocarpus sp. 6 AP-2014]
MPPACDIGYHREGDHTINQPATQPSMRMPDQSAWTKAPTPSGFTPPLSHQSVRDSKNCFLQNMARTLGALKQHLSGPETIVGPNAITDTENKSEQGVRYSQEIHPASG